MNAEAHPDADTLTAYLERALPARDRNHVLEHVAACSQCRDVLAVSLSETAEAVTAAYVAAVPSLPWWRKRWAPGFGLAASLATVAIIAAIVIEMPTTKHRSPSEKNAKLENRAVAPDNASTPAPANVQPSGITQPPSSLAESDRPLRNNSSGAGLIAGGGAALRDRVSGNDRLSLAGRAPANAKDANGATPPVDLTRNGAYAFEASSAPGTRQDYLNNQIFSMDGAANGAVQATELPPAPAAKAANPFQIQNSLSNSSQFAFSNLPPQTQQNTKVLVIHKPPSHSHFPMTVLDQIPLGLRRATPAIRPNVTGAYAMSGAELSPLREKSDIALGEVTVAGTTTDARRGDLDRSSAFSSRAMTDKHERKAEISATSSWKIDGGRLLKFADSGAWMEGYPASAGVDFSVVKSHGLDIWAGGSNAALLHSHDGGATWERITLGASATGTITAIEARGANVLVKSSSGQSWSSQDGGKSWTLLE